MAHLRVQGAPEEGQTPQVPVEGVRPVGAGLQGIPERLRLHDLRVAAGVPAQHQLDPGVAQGHKRLQPSVGRGAVVVAIPANLVRRLPQAQGTAASATGVSSRSPFTPHRTQPTNIEPSEEPHNFTAIADMRFFSRLETMQLVL